MIVTSRRSGPVFTADYWFRNGGAALTVDNDPNTTPPDPSRIGVFPKRGQFMMANANLSGTQVGTYLTHMSADGTAITVRPWFYDGEMGLWVPFTTAFTLTTAGNNFTQLSVRHLPGARFFVQVTANTGVTKIAIVFR